MTKMCRNAIHFPETGDIPDHVGLHELLSFIFNIFNILVLSVDENIIESMYLSTVIHRNPTYLLAARRRFKFVSYARFSRDRRQF